MEIETDARHIFESLGEYDLINSVDQGDRDSLIMSKYLYAYQFTAPFFVKAEWRREGKVVATIPSLLCDCISGIEIRPTFTRREKSANEQDLAVAGAVHRLVKERLHSINPGLVDRDLGCEPTLKNLPDGFVADLRRYAGQEQKLMGSTLTVTIEVWNEAQKSPPQAESRAND